MLVLALAAVVFGVMFVFVVPWVGIPAAAVGVILLGVYFASAGRRAATAAGMRAASHPGRYVTVPVLAIFVAATVFTAVIVAFALAL